MCVPAYIPTALTQLPRTPPAHAMSPAPHATQEAAAGGISLETSAEELATFSALWQLQPFTNEAAVDCLRRQAAAAGRGDDAAPRSLTAGA